LWQKKSPFKVLPKIPGINQRDAVRVFEKLGFRVKRQSGHIIMTDGKTRLVIPRHNPINAITMGGIAKTAGLTPEKFRELL
jgi:predicted RNA binding protein YcfA (HicA-like mRNA interferase family)